MNNKNFNAHKSNDTIHLIPQQTKKQRKHKHSRLPEVTRNEIVIDFINKYEKYENGILSLKKGAIMELSKKYKVDRGTISSMWRKKRKEPFHKNMRNKALQNNHHSKQQNVKNHFLKNKKVPDHVECVRLNNKIMDLELKLKKQQDNTEQMLNDLKVEFDNKVERNGERFQVLLEMTKKERDELSNENKTLKRNNNEFKEHVHNKETSDKNFIQTMKENEDVLLVENELLEQKLCRMEEENNTLREKLDMVKSWNHIQTFNGYGECMPPLMNYGNSCYINVVIQMILMIFYDYIRLVDCLITDDVLKKDKIVFGLILLVRTHRSNQKTQYVKTVKSILNDVIVQFDNKGFPHYQSGLHSTVEEFVVGKFKNLGSLVEDVLIKQMLLNSYKQLVETKTIEYKFCMGCKKFKEGQGHKLNQEGTHVAQLYRVESKDNNSIYGMIKSSIGMNVPIDDQELCNLCCKKKKWCLKNKWHDPPHYLQFLINHSVQSNTIGVTLPWSRKEENAINKVLQSVYENNTLRYVLVCICWRIEKIVNTEVLPHFFVTRLSKDGQWYKVDDDTIEITTKENMSELAHTNANSPEKLIFMKTSRGYLN